MTSKPFNHLQIISNPENTQYKQITLDGVELKGVHRIAVFMAQDCLTEVMIRFTADTEIDLNNDHEGVVYEFEEET